MYGSRNLSLNMPKNALFLVKNRKNRRALRAPPPDSLASGGWGLASPPDSHWFLAKRLASSMRP